MSTKPTDPSLPSLESNLFGTLFGFYKRIVELVRQSSVDDEGKALANERVKSMIDEIIADMGRSKDFNLKDRLESVYDDVKRLLDELEESSKR